MQHSLGARRSGVTAARVQQLSVLLLLALSSDTNNRCRATAAAVPDAAAGGSCIPITIMNDHSEALSAWISAVRRGRGSPPLSVLHVDRHADFNLPPRVFAPEPLHWNGDGGPDLGWLAAAEAAAVAEADLANFQLVGAWVGAVGKVLFLHGNASELFVLAAEQQHARCAVADATGMRCPMERLLLLQEEPDGNGNGMGSHFALAQLAPTADSVGGGAGGLGSVLRGRRPAATSRRGASFSHRPSVLVTAYEGHIDHPDVLDAPSDLLRGSGSDWVLDLDLDVFMPPVFRHRPSPWSYGQPLRACSDHLTDTGEYPCKTTTPYRYNLYSWDQMNSFHANPSHNF